MKTVINHETEHAPPKRSGDGWRRPIRVRYVQHPYNSLNAGQRQRLEAIASSSHRTDDEELIRRIEMGCNELAGCLMDMRDSTGQRLAIVVMGGRDWLTGMSVDPGNDPRYY